MIVKGHWGQHNTDTHRSTWSGRSYLQCEERVELYRGYT